MPGPIPDIMAMMNLERALSQQGQGGPQGMPPQGRMQVGPSANFGMSAGGLPMARGGDMSQANTEYLMALVKALKSSIPGTAEYSMARQQGAGQNNPMSPVNGSMPAPMNPGIRRRPPSILGGIRG